MTKRFYIIGVVEKSHSVTPLGWNQLKLSWADGMIGVCAVFTNKKKALKYAGKEFLIIAAKMETSK